MVCVMLFMIARATACAHESIQASIDVPVGNGEHDESSRT